MPRGAMQSYRDLAARGATAWWRYFVTIGFALVLAVALTLVAEILGYIAGVNLADLTQGMRDPGHPVGFFLLTGVVFLIVVLAFAIAIRVVHRKTFADVVGIWRWREFGAGFLLWAMASIALALIDVALAPSGFRVTASRETPPLALAALAGLAIQTFAEEFVFRGYLTQGLLLATGRTAPAAILSGLLFGAVNIPNGTPQAVSAAFSGMVLAWIAIRTGGIAVTWGQHLANNLLAAVVFVSKDDVFRNSPGLFTQNAPQLLWWDTATGVAALAVLGFVVFRATAADVPRAGQ